ncbi:hypothetical protein [Agrobacterium tumefaciens]|uniref:hypothetical protein n=1 Tax=Agrobacterium tumefaciens TaxID=358 RepID=UPI001573EA50|nr:hypothetical protein [Agrobacterium tumefaciens]
MADPPLNGYREGQCFVPEHHALAAAEMTRASDEPGPRLSDRIDDGVNDFAGMAVSIQLSEWHRPGELLPRGDNRCVQGDGLECLWR